MNSNQSVRASSNTSKKIDLQGTNDEIIRYVEVNNEGEIISFTVIDSKKSPTLDRAASIGIYQFLSGSCFVIQVLSGYGCADIARYVGLELINGFWMWNGMPYDATWEVTYGYIPGCLPMHSSTCFRATYTRID